MWLHENNISELSYVQTNFEALNTWSFCLRAPKIHKYIDVFLIFFSVVGMETRAFHMLGKCSTTELHLQPEALFF
jgi:hypothetical protein